MRRKLSFSLGAIVIVLLLSSTISVLEYTRMSDYVTERISVNVKCINITQNLSQMCEEYNLRIFDAIGEGGMSENHVPQFDEASFFAQCDSIRTALGTEDAAGMVDAVKSAYYIYIFSAARIRNVVDSDFIDIRDWYFMTLEPLYDRLRDSISSLAAAAYGQLQTNSESFQQGFYRSIIPGMVSAAVGLLLVLLLFFFLSVYYVTPIYRMLKNLKESILSRTKYRYEFEGNDQLAELNEKIRDIVDENVDLRHRARVLGEENESLRKGSGQSEK